jgi:hypothetical protein
LLDGQISRLRHVQDLLHVVGRASIEL